MITHVNTANNLCTNSSHQTKHNHGFLHSKVHRFSRNFHETILTYPKVPKTSPYLGWMVWRRDERMMIQWPKACCPRPPSLPLLEFPSSLNSSFTIQVFCVMMVAGGGLDGGCVLEQNRRESCLCVFHVKGVWSLSNFFFWSMPVRKNGFS